MFSSEYTVTFFCEISHSISPFYFYSFLEFWYRFQHSNNFPILPFHFGQCHASFPNDTSNGIDVWKSLVQKREDSYAFGNFGPFGVALRGIQSILVSWICRHQFNDFQFYYEQGIKSDRWKLLSFKRTFKDLSNIFLVKLIQLFYIPHNQFFFLSIN